MEWAPAATVVANTQIQQAANTQHANTNVNLKTWVFLNSGKRWHILNTVFNTIEYKLMKKLISCMPKENERKKDL